MNNALATDLYAIGKAHALASCLLHRASLEEAERRAVTDRARYAFNGPFSLSTQYLLGLGIELLLKSAIMAWDSQVDADYLRNEIGHDLLTALDQAELRGLTTETAGLRKIVEVLRKPYKKNWLRYECPQEIDLPADFDDVAATLTILTNEVASKLGFVEEIAS